MRPFLFSAFITVVLSAAGTGQPVIAYGQSYPDQQIRLIVPGLAGGGTDVALMMQKTGVRRFVNSQISREVIKEQDDLPGKKPSPTLPQVKARLLEGKKGVSSSALPTTNPLPGVVPERFAR